MPENDDTPFHAPAPAETFAAAAESAAESPPALDAPPPAALPTPPAVAAPAMKPALWAREKSTPDWQLAGASAHQRWHRDPSLLLTEEAFARGIAEYLAITCG